MFSARLRTRSQRLTLALAQCTTISPDGESIGNDARITDAIAMNAMQLLLAEIRTALSLMRTGIAVFALPLTVLSVLVATSKYYDALAVLHFLLPLVALCGLLLLLGGYLIVHALLKIRHLDRLLHRIKREHSAIAALVDSIA